MKQINEFILNLKPYKLASHKIWDNDEFDTEVLKLDWNEATIPPSPVVLERLKNLVLNNEVFNYYPNTNNSKVSRLLSNYLGESVDYFEYFSSSDVVHEHIARLLLRFGDKILILGPTYDNFRVTCEVQGAISLLFEPELDSLDPLNKLSDEILRLSPKLVYICNPNNPTGRLYTKNELEVLLSRFPKSIFVIDEAYYEFSNQSAMSLIHFYDNVIITRTFSKAFALANFRVGYVCSNQELISNLRKLKNFKNISSITQEAVIGALMDIDYMQAYVNEVVRARNFMAFELSKFHWIEIVYESHGNFLLIKFKSEEIKMAVEYYLQSNKIYVRNLTQSDKLRKCLRITIGTMEQMKLVVGHLKTFNESSSF